MGPFARLNARLERSFTVPAQLTAVARDLKMSACVEFDGMFVRVRTIGPAQSPSFAVAGDTISSLTKPQGKTVRGAAPVVGGA
jgi:hypothetical protein